MTTSLTYPNVQDLTADDYILLGLATCFIRDDGETRQVKVVEPIPSASLEAIAKGIPTSYELAYATTMGDILVGDRPQIPAAFPADAQLCSEFAYRATAAARTYKRRSVVQDLVPKGSTKTDFNYSTERKRVLNAERVVNTEDNVKQHAYTHEVL
jgi:hypothetical protein